MAGGGGGSLVMQATPYVGLLVMSILMAEWQRVLDAVGWASTMGLCVA